MSEKFSGVRVVSELALEMRSRLLTLAGPRRWTDTRESMLARAARRAGITYRTAKSLFYCESADPKSSVVERIRAATAEQEATNARQEYRELCDRIARLEADLRIQDEEFHSPDVDAFGAMARGSDRSMD